MKRARTAIVLLFSALVMSSTGYSQDDITIPNGPYLGQTPPGSKPEVFAPGIVNREESTDLEGMFGSDMNTFYFTREGEEYAGLVTVGTFEGDHAVIPP